MLKVFLKKHWQIILLNLIVLLCFILGYGRFGDVIFDSFREAYIPAQIIKGQVLYKNIFNIYAPFAYLFNALLFKIFGISLNVLYFAGLFTTLGIINLIFLISNKFLEKKYSFAITLFFIASSVLSANAFNCFFPYSYGMIYGLFFILGSLYAALNKQFILAYALYSFSICSKYEFILLLPLLIAVSWKNKSWKYIAALIMPAVITYLPLIIQKAGLNNLIISYQLILSMSATKTLYWFYSMTGLVFRPELIPIYLENFFKAAIPVAILYFINSYFILPFIFIYCYFISTPEILTYIFPLILILYAVRFKHLTVKEKLFIPACLLVSMKIFFALTLQSYGIYFVPFALIPVFILAPQKLKKSLLIVVIMCSISIAVKNITTLFAKNIKTETQEGIVYSMPYIGNSINSLVEYIQNNTREEDKVLVYPEGLSINVMCNRDSDNKFYSLIPLYIETFGEDIIIKRFEITKPDYIVISNYDTSSYYYSYFGVDYAGKIFNYILKNYEKQAQIGDKLKFVVFKLKSPHPSQKRA